MKLHLVDGTYELFRSHFAMHAGSRSRRAAPGASRPLRGLRPQTPKFGAPAATAPDGREVGATRGLMRSLLALLASPGVTHVACAFDTVIESFRNELYGGYKTSDGVPPELLAQFPLAERMVEALGMVAWRMVEFEADDALATAAARWAGHEGVEQVVICSPDKDLAQCVRGTRVVCFDRRRQILLDEAAVQAKFGVPPESIPDWLALVGDDADGYPGLPRWGARSAASLLAHYRRLEDIPDYERAWAVDVRGAAALGQTLRAGRADALLYRRLARLRTDVPLAETLDDLRWRGSRRDALLAVCAEIGEDEVPARMPLWRDAGGASLTAR